MSTPILEIAALYFTPSYIQKELGLSRFQLDVRIERSILPKPTYIDKNNVRYFSKGWLDVAKKTLQQNHNNRNTNAKSEDG